MNTASPHTSADVSADPPEGADGRAIHPRFVRILKRQPNGLVAFEFAVGWPDLSVELVLPEALFDEFCERQRVTFLTEPAADPLGAPRDEH